MNIALLGYGKMGRMIESLIVQEGRHQVVLRIDEFNRNSVSTEELKKADAAIDFSVPSAVRENVAWCLEAGVPLVIGTTGWYEALEAVKAQCLEKNGAVIYASNFSIGVNIFFEVNRRLAELMKDRKEYDPRITEIHHVQKLDKPSGTAITLANDILTYSPLKQRWSNAETAKQDELIILSRREGEVKGIHEVEYSSAVDRLTIRHEAFTREGFARGAVLAAEWINGKKGFYQFRDVLLGNS
jgi:4-hydroxy-tetrahydrodipicolinate reductase